MPPGRAAAARGAGPGIECAPVELVVPAERIPAVAVLIEVVVPAERVGFLCVPHPRSSIPTGSRFVLVVEELGVITRPSDVPGGRPSSVVEELGVVGVDPTSAEEVVLVSERSVTGGPRGGGAGRVRRGMARRSWTEQVGGTAHLVGQHPAGVLGCSEGLRVAAVVGVGPARRGAPGGADGVGVGAPREAQGRRTGRGRRRRPRAMPSTPRPAAAARARRRDRWTWCGAGSRRSGTRAGVTGRDGHSTVVPSQHEGRRPDCCKESR